MMPDQEILPLDRLRDLVRELLDENYRPRTIKEVVDDTCDQWRIGRPRASKCTVPDWVLEWEAELRSIGVETFPDQQAAWDEFRSRDRRGSKLAR